MTLLPIAEVFGHAVDHHNPEALKGRAEKWCRFRAGRCNKGPIDNPLGICSLRNGNELVTLCPSRFLEGGQIFRDVGRLAFGPNTRIVAAPEVHVLRVPKKGATTGGKRIGKVDFLIGRLDANDVPIDFAALEVQAVYFSGKQTRSLLDHFLSHGTFPKKSGRRPDWRSSAQKRLMPQVALKVPIFRRWGKKFFVATDNQFFSALPSMRMVDSFDNSEVTWLIYPFNRTSGEFEIGDPVQKFTTLDDVMTALREGVAPQPNEILEEIKRKKRERQLPVIVT
jgi:hypothetical protein